jgi:hypothetical protein
MIHCLLTIRVGEELLSMAPQLRVVSNMAVGVTISTYRPVPDEASRLVTHRSPDRWHRRLTMSILLGAARRIIEASLDARQGR